MCSVARFRGTRKRGCVAISVMVPSFRALQVAACNVDGIENDDFILRFISIEKEMVIFLSLIATARCKKLAVLFASAWTMV